MPPLADPQQCTVTTVQRVLFLLQYLVWEGIQLGYTIPNIQVGSTIAPEHWHVGRTLAGIQLQRGSIRDEHIGGEQIHIPPGPYGPALRDGLWQTSVTVSVSHCR